MARTALTVRQMGRFVTVSNTQYASVSLDVTNGNVAPNDGYTWLEFTLTGGVARTVTLAVPAGFDVDLAISSRSYPLPSNDTYRTGVFPMSAYGPQLLIDVTGAGVAVRLFSQRGAL